MKQKEWSCRLCCSHNQYIFSWAEFSLLTPWHFPKQRSFNKQAQGEHLMISDVRHYLNTSNPLLLAVRIHLSKNFSLLHHSPRIWFGFLAAGCPEGSFGPSCKHSCQCQNGAACDHVSGACTCSAGWTGTFCEKGDVPALLPILLCIENHASVGGSSKGTL